MDIAEQIRRYQTSYQQEEADRDLILRCLRERPLVFCREDTLAHMTASAWVVNPNRDKVLMAYHELYRSWSWMGGHADGEQNLLEVALREVREESGLARVRPLSEEIFSLEVLTVQGHEKGGRYVSSHLHLNVTYLLEAPEGQPLWDRPGENKKAAWFCLREAVEVSKEVWFRQRVYPKLNERLASVSGGLEGAHQSGGENRNRREQE